MTLTEWLDEQALHVEPGNEWFRAYPTNNIARLITLARASEAMVKVINDDLECPLCQRYVDCQYDCPAETVRRIMLEVEADA